MSILVRNESKRFILPTIEKPHIFLKNSVNIPSKLFANNLVSPDLHRNPENIKLFNDKLFIIEK